MAVGLAAALVGCSKDDDPSNGADGAPAVPEAGEYLITPVDTSACGTQVPENRRYASMLYVSPDTPVNPRWSDGVDEYTDRFLLLVGGETAGNVLLEDVWLYNLAGSGQWDDATSTLVETCRWHKLTDDVLPSADGIAGATLHWDQEDQTLVLVGGMINDGAERRTTHNIRTATPEDIASGGQFSHLGSTAYHELQTQLNSAADCEATEIFCVDLASSTCAVLYTNTTFDACNEDTGQPYWGLNEEANCGAAPRATHMGDRSESCADGPECAEWTASASVRGQAYHTSFLSLAQDSIYLTGGAVGCRDGDCSAYETLFALNTSEREATKAFGIPRSSIFDLGLSTTANDSAKRPTSSTETSWPPTATKGWRGGGGAILSRVFDESTGHWEAATGGESYLMVGGTVRQNHAPQVYHELQCTEQHPSPCEDYCRTTELVSSEGSNPASGEYAGRLRGTDAVATMDVDASGNLSFSSPSWTLATETLTLSLAERVHATVAAFEGQDVAIVYGGLDSSGGTNDLLEVDLSGVSGEISELDGSSLPEVYGAVSATDPWTNTIYLFGGRTDSVDTFYTLVSGDYGKAAQGEPYLDMQTMDISIEGYGDIAFPCFWDVSSEISFDTGCPSDETATSCRLDALALLSNEDSLGIYVTCRDGAEYPATRVSDQTAERVRPGSASTQVVVSEYRLPCTVESSAQMSASFSTGTPISSSGIADGAFGLSIFDMGSGRKGFIQTGVPLSVAAVSGRYSIDQHAVKVAETMAYELVSLSATLGGPYDVLNGREFIPVGKGSPAGLAPTFGSAVVSEVYALETVSSPSLFRALFAESLVWDLDGDGSYDQIGSGSTPVVTLFSDPDLATVGVSADVQTFMDSDLDDMYVGISELIGDSDEGGLSVVVLQEDPSFQGGINFGSLITLSTYDSSGNWSFQLQLGKTFAHEFVHQWSGHRLRFDNSNEIWIAEGLPVLISEILYGNEGEFGGTTTGGMSYEYSVIRHGYYQVLASESSGVPLDVVTSWNSTHFSEIGQYGAAGYTLFQLHYFLLSLGLSEDAIWSFWEGVLNGDVAESLGGIIINDPMVASLPRTLSFPDTGGLFSSRDFRDVLFFGIDPALRFDMVVFWKEWVMYRRGNGYPVLTLRDFSYDTLSTAAVVEQTQSDMLSTFPNFQYAPFVLGCDAGGGSPFTECGVSGAGGAAVVVEGDFGVTGSSSMTIPLSAPSLLAGSPAIEVALFSGPMLLPGDPAEYDPDSILDNYRTDSWRKRCLLGTSDPICAIDSDGDGHHDQWDCDDGNAGVNSAVSPELITSSGLDANCDGIYFPFLGE